MLYILKTVFLNAFFNLQLNYEKYNAVVGTSRTMDFWRSGLPTYMYIKLIGVPKGFGRICMFSKRYIIFTSVLIVLLIII